MSVVGINNSNSKINKKTILKIHSRSSSYNAAVEFLIVPVISNSHQYNATEISSKFAIPTNINLADPQFHEGCTIDILLGSGLFWELLCSGQIDLGRGQPIIQKTLLGWVVAGNFRSNHSELCHTRAYFARNATLESLDRNLAKFWELEELPVTKPLSKEEQLCENHFDKTTRRDNDGRFIVTIPLRENICLGDSLKAATKRLESMERKFIKNPEIKAQYCDFMAQYESLGHMSLIEDPEFDKYYYMPHHCVLRESLTTKLRVVFDASSKTTNGKSFNDFQLTGPILQDDLFAILIRFRKHRYVVCSDIEKMYRQVLVEPSQRDYQRIVWRKSPSDPISHYHLNTVTYGTTSASYL